MDRTLLISDIHLGSNACQEEQVLAFLKSFVKPTRLVIVGDLFDSTAVLMSQTAWEILLQLKHMHKQGVELVYIRGNHDPHAFVEAELMDTKQIDEYEFESGGKRFLCMHGHQFDPFMSQYPFWTDLFNHVDWLISWPFPRLGALLKRLRKYAFRTDKQVRVGCFNWARQRKVDVIVAGHTHFNEFIPGSLTYCNLGSWADTRCFFAVVEDGVINLCSFESYHHQ